MTRATFSKADFFAGGVCLSMGYTEHMPCVCMINVGKYGLLSLCSRGLECWRYGYKWKGIQGFIEIRSDTSVLMSGVN